jgi:hypothetical protein
MGSQISRKAGFRKSVRHWPSRFPPRPLRRNLSAERLPWFGEHGATKAQALSEGESRKTIDEIDQQSGGAETGGAGH